ncbi:MAG: sugar ABC transporter ATP-binding protein [Coraliomargaritaceae bacterium]
MNPSHSARPVLSANGLTKAFSGKTVVNGVSFDLRAGEALALIGENGAGKSTIKNMLCGLLSPTAGDIRIGGNTVVRTELARQGVSAVHQELSLFPSLTVAENICIMDLPGRSMNVDWSRANEIAKEQLDFLGIDIDPNALVETLGAGKRQIVEIAKALLHADKVLILDEPTTSLTSPERAKLFEILDKVKARGLAIVFISHFMEEIYRVCDSCIVLRDGAQVGAGILKEMALREIETLMVGRDMGDAQIEPAAHSDDKALVLENLSGEGFCDISFALHKGEILGFAGLMGAGRTEMAEGIFGVRPADGKLWLQGERIQLGNIAEMKRRNLCYVPEDRRTNGLFLNRPVRENLSAASLQAFIRRRVPFFGFRGEINKASEVVDRMKIALPHIDSPIENLSGGNQQKGLLGRWLSTKPEVVLFDEPTKGVDIGAKFDIHCAIMKLAESGVAVIVISSDLHELLVLSHRIQVMRKGRIAGEFERSDFNPASIISVASGAALVANEKEGEVV